MPDQISVFHITHVDNLHRIVADEGLLADSIMVARGGPATSIGMTDIKLARLTKRRVKCFPDDFVGEYVPFFYCPRSIMLYLFHMDNHPGLTYHGGQGPIVHLEADVHEIIEWAERDGRRWAFSIGNAGAVLTPFGGRIDGFENIDWAAVANHDFRTEHVKEHKQSEFLVFESVPWSLIREIGVMTEAVRAQVLHALDGAEHCPDVNVRREWYF